MFTIMEMVFVHMKRRRIFRLVLIAIWLVSVSDSLQPAWAAGVCSSGVTNIAEHHACCQHAVECPCEMKQSNSTKAPDYPLAKSSGLSYSANESLVLHRCTPLASIKRLSSE